MAILFILGALIFFIFALIKEKQKPKYDTGKPRSRDRTIITEIEEKEEENRAKARRRYVSKSMREYILERDNYTCQICGISKELLDDYSPGLGDYLLLEIDHITSVAEGGSGDNEENLQTLCWRCNRKKGKDKTNEDVQELIDYGIDRLN